MANRLMYPRTSVSNTGMFITFRAYDYSAAPEIPGALKDIRNVISRQGGPVTLTESNFAGGKITPPTGGKPSENTAVANISLYLPPKIEYSYGAEWNKVSFGALGSVLGAEGPIDLVGAAGKLGLATAGNAIVNALMGVAGFKDIPKVSGLSLDSIVGAAFGQTFNDNTLQTFDRMQMRTFNFNYLMLARDQGEENEIQQIIRQFKISMHPSSKEQGRSNSLFLGYPHIWRIIPSGLKSKLKIKSGGNVRSAGVENGDVSNFLPNTKYCALTGLNVDYTPDNVIALTRGGYVQAVRISLQFSELTNLVRQDIEGFEDPLSAGANSSNPFSNSILV